MAAERCLNFMHSSPVSKRRGERPLDALAYITGERQADPNTGTVHSIRSERDDVVHTAFYCPNDAPAWARDEQEFWSRLTLNEHRANARFAMHEKVAIPGDLTQAGREKFAELYAADLVGQGLAVSVAIHADRQPREEWPEEKSRPNWHMHAIIACTPVGSGGFEPKLARVVDGRLNERNPSAGKPYALWRRDRIAVIGNRLLADAGVGRTIETPAEQAQRMPQRKLGPKLARLKREGGRVILDEINQLIRLRNVAASKRKAQEARLKKIKDAMIARYRVIKAVVDLVVRSWGAMGLRSMMIGGRETAPERARAHPEGERHGASRAGAEPALTEAGRGEMDGMSRPPWGVAAPRPVAEDVHQDCRLADPQQEMFERREEKYGLPAVDIDGMRERMRNSTGYIMGGDGRFHSLREANADRLARRRVRQERTRDRTRRALPRPARKDERQL